MQTNDLIKSSGGSKTTKRVCYLAIIRIAAIYGIALVFLTVGCGQITKKDLASLPDPVSPTSTSPITVLTIPTTAEPMYFKKELVFKRTLAAAEDSSIRTSALSPGYVALAEIPPAVVAPQLSVRVPQFPNRQDLNNYQALSTLGTQQFYSNLNVQQFLNNLSTRQYINDLSNRQFFTNLDNQQYVAKFNQRMIDLSIQQFLTNIDNQQFLNNFNLRFSNSFSNQAFLNSFNTQQFYNSFSNQQYLNNLNSFSNRTFFQPIQPIIIPPPPRFNFP